MKMKNDVKRSLWIVNFSQPAVDSNGVSRGWTENGQTAVIADTLEQAAETVKKNYPQCRLIQVNKHTNNILVAE